MKTRCFITLELLVDSYDSDPLQEVYKYFMLPRERSINNTKIEPVKVHELYEHEIQNPVDYH